MHSHTQSHTRSHTRKLQHRPVAAGRPILLLIPETVVSTWAPGQCSFIHLFTPAFAERLQCIRRVISSGHNLGAQQRWAYSPAATPLMGMQTPHPLVPGPHREADVGRCGCDPGRHCWTGARSYSAEAIQASSFCYHSGSGQGSPGGREIPSPASGEPSLQV